MFTILHTSKRKLFRHSLIQDSTTLVRISIQSLWAETCQSAAPLAITCIAPLINVDRQLIGPFLLSRNACQVPTPQEQAPNVIQCSLFHLRNYITRTKRQTPSSFPCSTLGASPFSTITQSLAIDPCVSYSAFISSVRPRGETATGRSGPSLVMTCMTHLARGVPVHDLILTSDRHPNPR
jgi:hypothetical protein